MEGDWTHCNVLLTPLHTIQISLQVPWNFARFPNISNALKWQNFFQNKSHVWDPSAVLQPYVYALSSPVCIEVFELRIYSVALHVSSIEWPVLHQTLVASEVQNNYDTISEWKFVQSMCTINFGVCWLLITVRDKVSISRNSKGWVDGACILQPWSFLLWKTTVAFICKFRLHKYLQSDGFYVNNTTSPSSVVLSAASVVSLNHDNVGTM